MKLWIAIFGVVAIGQSISMEKERALGAGLAAEFRKQSRPLEIPEVSVFVERVGSRLASLVPGTTFRFEVVLADTREPIGIPDGFVFVPARFFLAIQDDAEFAGMLAHAMGHVVLRHGMRPVRPAGDGGIPLLFPGGWMGVHADSQHRDLLVPAGILPAFREYELEADRYGAELAGRAGYDSAALRSYVRRVQPEDIAGAVPSPLPNKVERIAALEKFDSGDGEVLGSEFVSVREIVRTALAGPVRLTPSLRR